MEMEDHAASCYCCAKPSTSRAAAMDIGIVTKLRSINPA